MQHISFPSIPQLRNVIKEVKETSLYHKEPLPTLKFTGTVKLHGTNHGICKTPSGEIYSQSRSLITTVGSDNCGSAAFTESYKEQLAEVFDRIAAKHVVGVDETIQIFGEWCGSNIQKNVGIANLEKMLVVFGIRISKDADSQKFLPLEDLNELCHPQLTTCMDFSTYEALIDFSNPNISTNFLADITEAVEKDCPVARQLLGKDYTGELVGEGVVWSTVYKGNTLRFKVKGEKHSSSKVKTLASVDVEKVASIAEFIEYAVTESRLKQGLEHISADSKNCTGDFIKWVMNDIIKEESDTLQEASLTTKDIAGPCASKVRNWFLQRL